MLRRQQPNRFAGGGGEKKRLEANIMIQHEQMGRAGAFKGTAGKHSSNPFSLLGMISHQAYHFYLSEKYEDRRGHECAPNETRWLVYIAN